MSEEVGGVEYGGGGTWKVLKSKDKAEEAALRIPPHPDEPLPSDEDRLLGGMGVLQPRESRRYPGKSERSQLDQERKALETEYWLEGMSQGEAKERAAAAVRTRRAKGEI